MLASGLVSDYIAEKEQILSRIVSRNDASSFIMELRYDESGILNDGYAINMFNILRATTSTDSDVQYAWALSNDPGNAVSSNSTYISPGTYSIKDQKWFKSAISTDAPFEISPLYQSMFDKDLTVFSIISPVNQNGNIIGWFGIEVDPSALFNILNKYISNDGSFPIIYSSDHTVIYAPTENKHFTDRYNVEQPPIASFIARTPSMTEDEASFTTDSGERVYYYLDSGKVPGWSILVVFNVAELGGDAYHLFFVNASVLLLCLAIFFIVINAIMRDRLKLLTPITDALSDFLVGNYKTRINSEQRGQLGYAARAVDTLGKKLADKSEAADNLAYIDPITGLENRIKLYGCIDDHLSARNATQKTFAVLFLDLDNFKWLNETYGHKFGDEALSVFAKALSDAVTPDAQVFRYTGDEFLLVYDFDTKEDLDDFANKLHAAFNAPFRVSDDSIYFRFSCGIAIYPDNGLTADDMLREAAYALSSAKSAGKNRISYVPKDENIGPKKAYIAQVLTHALPNRELYLNYQPIVAIETGRVYGFEALLRWENPEFGNIPPADFIAIAEESGEIVKIGMWILENACRFIQRINREYDRDVVISVNVSPVQLRQHDYIEHIRDVIAISHINPANIQLEITEGTLVDFIDNRNETLEEVIATGITLALDDFGTGYSSMAYLKNLPVTCLKIDKMFVDGVGESEAKSSAITASTIELVHGLGLVIVAEGIETREQYELLKKLHCDYIQGYLFSKPLLEERALEFIPKFEQLHNTSM
jgi:diguanylate cyclase (GGDEF)-like protein